MKNPRFLFLLIIVLTAFAILIDLPKSFKIFNREFSGLNPNFSVGPIKVQRDFSFRKGLDLEGGVSITYKADTKGVAPEAKENALEGAKTVIERRINLFGVSEPVIQTATVNGESRIIVELPGVTDINQAINLIGTTAQLSFWEEGPSSGEKPASTSALPKGILTIFSNPQKTNLSGKDLQQSNVSFDRNTGKPEVQLVFTSEGSQKFAEITKNNVGKVVAIVLDNQVIEAPKVNEAIVGGNAVITGNFTLDQAKNLSIQLNAGALPLPLTILEQQRIGATLGEISLQKSLFAGVLGLVIIIIFMCVLYGELGLIASFALIIYTLLVLAVFKIIPVTLTLAGIAGFILSIGMAVDANILIFERMKEELRLGKHRDIAIEQGFTRAWTSIRDSNVSSIITSLILIYFGTGIVRGFAVTLLIGVLISMFSAIVVTRTFLRIIYK